MIDTKSPWILPFAILSLACIIAFAILGNNIKNITKSSSIQVAGTADEIVTSDIAKWAIDLTQSTGSDNFKEGASLLQKDRATITEFLISKGINKEEINLQPVNTSPQYDYSSSTQDKSTGSLKGYILNQRIIVETNQVDKISGIAQDIGSLANSGVIFSSSPIEYYYSKLNDKKLELITKATEEARKRATQISEAAGSSLGNLKSASQGVTQVTAVNSTEISDYGYVDTTSIKKKMTVIVRTEFDLK